MSVIGGSPPERIVRLGGDLVATRPTAEDPKLYLKFSQVRTAQELLTFIARYGFLTNRPSADPGKDHDHYEDVWAALRSARQMREVIHSRTKGTLGQGRIIDFKRLSASLVSDPFTERLTFQFRANTLNDALWFQLGKALLSGALKECLQCGVPFEAGVGAGRRADAKFCSDPHREAFKSRKRSQRES